MKSVSVKGLGKRYSVYFEKPALIKSILPFLVTQGRVQQFWALRDIDLEVGKGECVGVVGPNGCGKSTILSVLAGVTAPTEGTVTIDGKVSSLLTLGAGFNFELTGQENVYLNSAILGLSKAQVDSIYEDIVEFADLGKFMNAKLSTYSSGMNMRLGFAIAIMVPFDVLLIDEILAVGDMEFQTKCFRTMRKFYEDEGKTIIFVSHALAQIEELCSSAIWFEHGRIEEYGDTDRVLSKYRERYREKYLHIPLKAGILKSGYLKEKLKVARIDVDAGKTLRRIPKTLFGSNLDWIIDGIHLYDRNRKVINPYILHILAPYGIASFRYPGGVQTDYFHWAEAIGPERKRQRCGYPGNPESYPHFGPDEFIEFCRSTNALPHLSFNVGTGTDEEALGWVRYCRDKGLRVEYGELGHELYYDDYHHLGTEFAFTPEQYAEKAARFARALKSFDPDLRVGAIGCCDTGVFSRYRSPDWNRVVLERLAGEIDYLAVHNTSAPILNITPDYGTPDQDATYLALMAAPQYVERNMERVKSDLKSYGAGAVKLAVSQYRAQFEDVSGTIHGSHHVRGKYEKEENWRQNKTLGAALYEAMLLNIFIRDPDIVIAQRYSLFHTIYSSLFEVGMNKIIFHPHALMFKLYAKLAGKQLVECNAESDTFSSEAVGIIPPQENVPYLDAIAARDDGNSRLAVFVVNRNLFRDIVAEVTIKGYEPTQVVMKHLMGPSFDSNNQFHEPSAVNLVEHTNSIAEMTDFGTGRFRISFPMHSLTVLSFSKKEEWF